LRAFGLAVPDDFRLGAGSCDTDGVGRAPVVARSPPDVVNRPASAFREITNRAWYRLLISTTLDVR